MGCENFTMRKNVSISRDGNGVVHVNATGRQDVYWGLGYAHAQDRGMQMALMRILGQGRSSEQLSANDETLAMDKFFRRMNWCSHCETPLNDMTSENVGYLENYCEGVNAGFKRKYPWELKLLGCRHENWTPNDTVMLTRMSGYLTLAQSQAEIQRLLVEMVQSGVSDELLEELFPNLLGEMDRDLIVKTHLAERIVPPEVLWKTAIPRMMASNNWVVAGSRSASGHPIVCNDPHLETNRLPNIWYEAVLSSNGRYCMGGTMPGFPCILAGRTNDIAWGVTYAFVDAVDSWIEKCRAGSYFREDSGWQPFDTRTEVINRKKRSPIEITFYENDHGTLEGDPNIEGHYLATRWAPAQSGSASLNGLFDMWNVTGVREAGHLLRQVETGWSFVAADTADNILFQMSGLVPRRRSGISGLVPLPGWKRENDWQGFVAAEKLPRSLNPDKGYFVTANNDLNEFGVEAPIDMCMGDYRARRISQLLAARDTHTMENMADIQKDLYSIQAKEFMSILEPLLPQTSQAQILRDWNYRYDENSQGAFLFERVYHALYRKVFGEKGVGTAVIDYLRNETGTFTDFYANFDRILTASESAWFAGHSRDELYRQVLKETLNVTPRPLKINRQIELTHILLGGKLPRWLGFDLGPITCCGSLATVCQGQIYRSAKRLTTFMPSFRFITDLGHDRCLTSLAGGPSDRRFSKWYSSDLANWMAGRYKIIQPQENTLRPFKR
jgi:penicillin amidase